MVCQCTVQRTMKVQLIHSTLTLAAWYKTAILHSSHWTPEILSFIMISILRGDYVTIYSSSSGCLFGLVLNSLPHSKATGQLRQRWKHLWSLVESSEKDDMCLMWHWPKQNKKLIIQKVQVTVHLSSNFYTHCLHIDIFLYTSIFLKFLKGIVVYRFASFCI